MSNLPKIVWLAVHASPWCSTYAHPSQSGAEYSAHKTASGGMPRPTVARYDLADPERDAREAEALDLILTYWPIENWVIDATDAHAVLTALRDRLRGGAQ